MKTAVHVHCDGDWESPEVSIHGSAKALEALGSLLNGLKEAITLETPGEKDEVYPVVVKSIVIEPVQSGNERITVTINKNEFKIVGTDKALEMLGANLVGFDEFVDDGSINYHIHMDYYDENQNLNETNCSLIITCDRYSINT